MFPSRFAHGPGQLMVSGRRCHRRLPGWEQGDGMARGSSSRCSRHALHAPAEGMVRRICSTLSGDLCAPRSSTSLIVRRVPPAATQMVVNPAEAVPDPAPWSGITTRLCMVGGHEQYTCRMINALIYKEIPSFKVAAECCIESAVAEPRHRYTLRAAREQKRSATGNHCGYGRLAF